MAYINYYVKIPELRAAMIEKSVHTKSELRILTDLSPQAMNELFNRPEKPKRLKTCIAVSRALNKDLDELFETK